MDDGTTELNTSSRKELAAHIERIESLTEEKKQVAEHIKAEFAQAASAGYDAASIKQILKERAADSEKSVTQRAVTATYRRAIASLSGTPLGDWARNWMAHEARINRTEKEESPQMAEFLKGRKAKATDGNGDAAQA